MRIWCLEIPGDGGGGSFFYRSVRRAGGLGKLLELIFTAGLRQKHIVVTIKLVKNFYKTLGIQKVTDVMKMAKIVSLL